MRSTFFKCFMTRSPISCEETSSLPSSIKSCLTRSAISRIWSIVTGLFSQAFWSPRIILFMSKRSMRPSFFFTISSIVSTYSYVVKRFPHSAHSLRLLIALSGESLVSRVFISLEPQYGHFICFTFARASQFSVLLTKVDAKYRV